ncbi:hypothetical protein BLOT_014030 [Blomia tropicalis]|nr:hypothetical protein BLOT_014030 [Blomia tropicalis]
MKVAPLSMSVYVLWIDSLEDNEIVEHDMFTLNRPTGQHIIQAVRRHIATIVMGQQHEFNL